MNPQLTPRTNFHRLVTEEVVRLPWRAASSHGGESELTPRTACGDPNRGQTCWRPGCLPLSMQWSLSHHTGLQGWRLPVCRELRPGGGARSRGSLCPQGLMQGWFHSFLSGVEWGTCNWLTSDRCPSSRKTEAAYLRQDELHSSAVSTLACPWPCFESCVAPSRSLQTGAAWPPCPSSACRDGIPTDREGSLFSAL